MSSQNSGNAQISDVKTAKTSFEFLIDQRKLMEQFLTIVIFCSHKE